MTEDQKALKTALGFLRTRDRFEGEIRAHLGVKGFSRDAVEYVVRFLSERRLINDQRTITALIEKNSGKRSVGIERLRAELEKRGAPEQAIESDLAVLAASESDRALDALRAKYKGGIERSKAGRFLCGRGFSEEAVESALEAYFGSPD